MDTKDIDIIKSALKNTLNNIEQPLKIIALLKLADEFYSKDERKKYYGEYNILCENSKQARIDHRNKTDQKASQDDINKSFTYLCEVNDLV